MLDAVVLGLGGVGSFTLRALSRHGHKAAAATSASTAASASCPSSSSMNILGIERFTRAHSLGSSHGHSRIYRHAYFEHEDYVPLLKYSTREFQKLQEESNVDVDVEKQSISIPILEECGNLIMDRSRGELIEACLSSARAHAIPVELLDHHQLQDRFGSIFDFDEDTYTDVVGMLEKGAGFIRPERAIEAALDDAERQDREGDGVTVDIWENTKVLSLQETIDDAGNPFVRLTVERHENNAIHSNNPNDPTTATATATANANANPSAAQSQKQTVQQMVETRAVIITAGAWTSALIPSWKPYLTPTRQIQAWMDVSSLHDSHKYDSTNMPTWLSNVHHDANANANANAMPIYGIPADEKSDIMPHCIKIALHGRNDPISNPDECNHRTNPVTNSELVELQNASANIHKCTRHVPWVDAKPCMYTMTPDEHFMVGSPRGSRCIFAAAGLSGHGFKMVPALGRILADMVLRRESRFEIEFLSPSRFGV